MGDEPITNYSGSSIKISAENYMKVEEIGPRGGASVKQ